MSTFRFPKSERICNKSDIELLFSKSASLRKGSVILRFAFRESLAGESHRQVLIVVPKKRVKRAVDRNKLKRQLREIYRLNKLPEIEYGEGQDRTLLIALIYSGQPKAEYPVLEKQFNQAMAKMRSEIAEGLINKN